MDDQALAQLNEKKQEFFLPFYCAIVERHPLGIGSADVKQIARQEIIERFGFDPFDPSLTGTNPSTQDSAASQWANNLVSNRVLDREDMIVARGGSRTVLYPLTEFSNLIPREQHSQELDEVLKRTADERPRSASRVETLQYLRSPALAEYVRELSGHQCTVGAPDCITFTGRNDRPYVEVHHMIPMAEQRHTQFNLDRTANMVAICPGCHLRLHRGSRTEAEAALRAILEAYRGCHGVSLSEALKACDLPSGLEDLLGYYSL